MYVFVIHRPNMKMSKTPYNFPMHVKGTDVPVDVIKVHEKVVEV